MADQDESDAPDGPFDDAVEARLAELDALRAAGDLSEADYAVARRLAILRGAAQDDLPPPNPSRPPGAYRKPASPAQGAGGPSRRWWIGAGVAALAAAVGLLVGVLITRGGDAPGQAASAPATTGASPGSGGQTGPPPVITACANAGLCPSVSSVTARDAGGLISVAAEYCDRTPGDVNEFVYTFTIIDASGGAVASIDERASQTQACNTVSAQIPDAFPAGMYQAVVQVDNLTNAVSGGSTSGHFRVS